MRIQTLVAGVCAAAFFPTLALAQQTCEQRQNTRAAGAVAGRGDHPGGAVAGNQLARGAADCARAYGFYDNDGAWHARAVARHNATGYFDRTGAWVDGAPAGQYGRDGRWVQTTGDAAAAGYYDSRGHWAPAAASGYYTGDGRWVAAAAAGHHDGSGRWIAGASTGRYNSDGQWLAGQAGGRRDATGVWIADPQPGRYENGRWIRGEAVGYYDGRGRWVSTEARAQQAVTQARGAPSIDARQAQLARRIDRGIGNGGLSRMEGQQALNTLASIEREERSLRNRQGVLGPRGRATINGRLDQLSATLREDVRSERDDPSVRYGSR